MAPTEASLEALSKLSVLYLNNNNIKVIKNLESLINLETLYLDTNQLTNLNNLECLEKFEKLSVLFLGMNPIEGEEKQFMKDNIARESVRELLQSYRAWKEKKK